MKETKKKTGILPLLMLQGGVIVYTLSSIFARLSKPYPVMSKEFLFFMFLDLLSLGVYAIIWQQMIKIFDLSIAYANRASAIFWSMIWAAVLFKETITVKNLIGVAVIFAGIIMVNQDAA